MKNPRLPDLVRIDEVSVMVDGNDKLLDIELVKNVS